MRTANADTNILGIICCLAFVRQIIAYFLSAVERGLALYRTTVILHPDVEIGVVGLNKFIPGRYSKLECREVPSHYVSTVRRWSY